MKKFDFLEALGDIDEKLINEAAPRKRFNTSAALRYGSIAATFIILCSAVFFFIPKMMSGGNSEHVHEYGEWMITSFPTCSATGERVRHCSCGAVEKESIAAKMHLAIDSPALSPTCSEHGKEAGSICEHCNEVLEGGELIPPTAEHVFVGGKCKVCGYAGNELAYSLSADGTSYKVSGIGGYSDLTSVVIPESYNSLPVTAVGKEAFAKTAIVSVVIPDSVTVIEAEAFYYCEKLENVTLGKNVRQIGGAAFSGCKSASLQLPDKLQRVERSALSGTTITNADFPQGLIEIGELAFAECTFTAKSLTIPKSVTLLEREAFKGICGVDEVTLNASVDKIPEGAFTEASIKKINIGSSIKAIETHAFHMHRLTEIVIPSNVKSIGWEAFLSNNATLNRIVIEEGVESIGNRAFAFSTYNAVGSYKEKRFSEPLVLPKSLKSVDTSAFTELGIGELIINSVIDGWNHYVFQGNYNLTSVTIAEGSTKIPTQMFYDCPKFKEFTLPTTVKAMDSAAMNISKLTFKDGITKIDTAALFGNHGVLCSVKEVIIPESVTEICDNAFSCASINKVVFEGNRVTKIGEKAFYNCQSLKEFSIPTAVRTIGSEAFANTKLTEITIPQNVTSLGEQAFGYCKDLQKVTILGNISRIEDYTFANTNIKEIVFPTGVVVLGSHIFDGTDIVSVVLPDTLKTIGNEAFKGCKSLTSINFPTSLQSIGNSAFEGCTGLKGSFTINASERIGERAFAKCEGLTAVTLNGELTSIEREAFAECTNLKSVNLPQTLVGIGEKAFIYTSSLRKITIPSSVSYMGEFVFGFSGIESAVIEKGDLTKISPNTFYTCTNLKHVSIPEGITEYGDAAFWETALTVFPCPSTLTKIGEYAFAETKISGKLTIPEQLTDMRKGVFFRCYGITEIEILSPLTRIPNNIFRYCTSLTKVTFPDTVTEIGDYSFSVCTSLKNFDFTNIRIIGEGGFYNTGFEGKFVVPSHIEVLGDYAFGWCQKMTEVVIDCKDVDIEGAFWASRSITKATIGKDVKSLIQTFRSCTALTEVIFEGDKVESIGKWTFEDCDSLVEITLPSAVKEIGEEAFANCAKLKNVSGFSADAVISSDAFIGSPHIKTD